MPELTPNPFAYIKPDPRSVQLLEGINEDCQRLYATMLNSIPDCRERAVAITKLQEVRMWANCSVVMTQMRERL